MKNKKGPKNSHVEIWHYLFKELSKLNDVLALYEKIFLNINIKNDRYNNLFQLILDQFSRSIIITLDIFFQKRNDVWSLEKLTSRKEEIKKIKRLAEKYIVLRNEWAGHVSIKRFHVRNFGFLNQAEVSELKKIIEKIGELLTEISREHGRDETYAMGWIGVENDMDNFFNDLNNKF